MVRGVVSRPGADRFSVLDSHLRAKCIRRVTGSQLGSQVDVGLREGLRHDSSVHCDELVSLRKSQLTQFVGSLDATKLKSLDDALMVALGCFPDREN